MQYRKRMLRKKGTALLLSALLLASALPLAAYAEEVSAKTTEYVNFRSGPGTNYSSQGIIASGTTITVTDTSNSEWYAVRLSNGSTGYIYAEYISMSTSGSTSNGEERSAKTTEYVNFRSGPGTNYSSKGVISLGTTVTVTDTSNAQWYAVRLSNGSTGYIFAEYISFTGSNTPSATAAPTQAPSNGSEQTAKTTEYVNFRSGPGTNYSSKGVIALGTTVTVTDTSNSEWYAVRLSNGSTGYIFAQYLKLNSSSSATATPAPSGSEQTAKTTEYVNFRSGPGTNYSSKGVIALGTTVTVTDTSNSEWYAVRLSNGSTGYIFAQYLKLNSSSSATATPAPTQAPSGSEQSAKTTEYVNFRSGPGTNYSSKGVIASGTTVTVTDRSNSQWYAVRLANGSTGYIFAQYLKVTGTSSATPTPTPTQAPSNDGTVQAKLTADVNLRRGAGTNYGVIKVIGTGTTVTVTDASNSQWYKVKLSDGTEGYLFSEYLKVTSGNIDSAKPSATPTPTPAPSNGTVQAKTTSDLNVRKGPGTSYGIIKVIDMNVTVTVTEATNSSWYKVKLSDGTEGYLAAQYLKITSGDINSVKPGNSGDDNTNNGNNSNTPATGEYVRVTVGLNLRSEPNTSCKVLTVLSTGTVLNVLDRKTSGWVHVRTTGGAEGYVSAEYVTAYDPSSSSASVSVSSVDLAQYKTIYIQASASGSVTWESSDASVATAKAGVSGQLFIYGAAPGTAKITAKSANGTALATVSVTVSAPEAVRFAYTTPNIITAGASFNLKAVTDTQKSAVRFEIDGVGTYDTTSYDSESQGDNNVRIFSASATISTPGTYTVRAYSSSGGGYSSDYREFTILVVSTTDSDMTTGESRRVSDSMLDNIASYEGYVPQVSPDTLAGNIPTVGYGYVVSKNTTFYNNLTRSEAKAMLADTVNRGSYTTEINRFISSNGLLMSQCQFDALASFSYNVGAGYWNGSGNCYVRTVIMNAVVPPQDLSSSNPYGGKVTASTLPMYQDHSASSTQITTLKINTSVNILDYYRDSSTKQSWYKVSASGKSGWVRAGDVAFNSTSGLTHDLNYVDAYTFGSNLLDWHVAGGNCYIGLYYRRLAEAKVFSYGNYAEASPSNGNYKKNTYGYKVPSCL
ncbi:SH3 domain-containing protein [Neglectibacter sp. CSJ-5]|uniref:SH3 domain-containing protein n=1 Tax=Neglectibacter sp. CSJ-5 TaxID=3078043 RepID=UPI00292F5FAE|nr:SH3 domain-containing protein [Neglectibacter sp. CSJ-5]